MDYNKAALEMHETHKGKVGIVSKVEVATRDDLSTAYTPGVAEPCRKIKENPDDVYKYTFKGNMVAVVSNGTAVLGLGDIGPEAGLPVMEGKAVLFKEFGGVDAFPICIDAHDAASVIAACKAIAPTFGGINLEDIKSPECFEIEETLERELDIPVFHDDQHGTAIVVTAALINALRVVNKKMEDVHIVLNGPGAAGTAIIKMLMTAGAKDIVAVDQFGTLYKGCNSAEAHKNWLGEVTNPRQIKGGLKEAIEGADVFIGVSRPGILTTELCKTMNKDAIVFAMANPTPEIMPDEAKAGGWKAGDFSYNTGRLRCPTCDGTGSISLDVQFLPDVDIECPDCRGSRYAPEADAIHRTTKDGRELTLPQLMAMSVDQALAVTGDMRKVHARLTTLHDLGLGYLTLGEPTPALSGGEAQRLKLASEMGRAQSHAVFVFDEPTIGLHPLDVRVLLGVFDRLVASGATVVVIEHDLDVIANADWMIDMGPGGGESGGRIVAAGTPEQIAADANSVTGRYLR